MNLTISPSGPLRGKLAFPGDKSISHRAVIFGSIAQGMTTIQNLLEGEDVLRTVQIFRDLGVKITRIKKSRRAPVWKIVGRGIEGLCPPKRILYCGNSGTTMRLMMGLLAGLPFKSVLTGDDSLDRRPMERVSGPLRQMGAKISEVRRGGRRLIVIEGTKLRGIHYRSPIASAQVKSAILLAGLTIKEKVSVTEPVLSRDHTERMLRLFRSRQKNRTLVIPGDPSSAAFFVVAGLINPHPKTRLELQGVDLNPTRAGFLTVLKKIGARVQIKGRRLHGGEPVGTLLVQPSRLRAAKVGGAIVPSLIDEVPILGVAGACARGSSHFKDVAELRVKETDRIETLEKNFRRLGIGFRSKRNSFEIRGYRERSQSGAVDEGNAADESLSIASSYGDHRIAMSLAILGTVFPRPLLIQEVACINTSFPQFFDCLKKIGVKFKIFKRNFL